MTEGTKSDLFALDCSRRYGYLRPTNPTDTEQLDRLAGRGLLEKGSGPVKGDARCGHYWIITDAGRAALVSQREGSDP